MAIRMTKEEFERKYGIPYDKFKSSQQQGETKTTEDSGGFLSNVLKGAGKLKESVSKHGKEAMEAVKGFGVQEPYHFTGERKGQGFGETLLKVLGSGARVVTDFTGGAFGGAVEKVSENIRPETKERLKQVGTNILNTEVGKMGLSAISKGIDAWKEFEKKQPDAAEDLRNIGAIAEAIGDLTGIGATKKLLTKGTEKVTEKAVGEFGEQVGKKGESIVSKFAEKKSKKLADKEKDIVGQILQPKNKYKLKSGAEALEEVDTKGVKTYSQLKDKINARTGEIARELDNLLEKQKINYRIKDLVTTAKIGNRTVKQNFVTKAIDQLSELYTKIDDLEANAKILNLKSKLRRKGLTAKELNDLSREYGSTFSKKAFSKVTNEPLTSVNAQAFENVRKGLKNTVRSKIKGRIPEQLDKKMSALINTSKGIAKLEERVNIATQKLRKQGLLKKLGSRLGVVAGAAFDTATFGIANSFISRLLPRTFRESTSMSILEIESVLKKNLKQFEKIVNKRISESKKLDQLEKFFLDLQKKGAETEGIKVGLSIEDVSKKGKVRTTKNKVISNLESKAKKYKSAEEFVRRQKVMHGTTDIKGVVGIGKIRRSETGMLGHGGVFWTKSEKDAERWISASAYSISAKQAGKESGIVYLFKKDADNFNFKKMSSAQYERMMLKSFSELEKNPKKFGTDKYGVHEDRAWKIAENKLKKQGYDGIDFRGENTGVIFVSKNIVAKTKSQLKDIWEKANKSNIKKVIEKRGGGKTNTGFKGLPNLTLKTVEKLKGKTTVSKQFISDLTNSPDLRQAERDIIRRVLKEMPEGKVNVKEFADKVKTELLPLKRINANTPIDEYASNRGEHYGHRYEGITLPSEVRGNVANYSERIYESPIKTSAGNVHFDTEDISNYFAHTRIEDMAKKDTRRVIEIQSDLFQKGRLENETPRLTDREVVWGSANREQLEKLKSDALKHIKSKKVGDAAERALKDYEKADKILKAKEKEFAKLQPYRNTWHERIIKEEIKQAAKDGKTKLQFPTGETAMKIEGLGDSQRWYKPFEFGTPIRLKINDLKVGREISQGRGGGNWIITDVFGDGKFKAVPKNKWDAHQSDLKELKGKVGVESTREASKRVMENSQETFDISGKVDTSNPIFKFYEKDIQKYLKRIEPKMQRITDEQGVSWFEIPVTKDKAKMPVEAFAGVLLGKDDKKDNNKSFSIKDIISDRISYKKGENNSGKQSLSDKILHGGRIIYKKDNSKKEKVTNNTDAIAKGLAYAETRGVNKPYTFSQWSNPKLKEKSPYGKALGKYQITEARLKEKSKDFLGAVVTPKEFLENPSFQEKFIRKQIDWQRSMGLTNDEIIATHRHGWGKMTKEQLKKAVEARGKYIEDVHKGMKSDINKIINKRAK